MLLYQRQPPQRNCQLVKLPFYLAQSIPSAPLLILLPKPNNKYYDTVIIINFSVTNKKGIIQ